jgi:hypothetical protein
MDHASLLPPCFLSQRPFQKGKLFKDGLVDLLVGQLLDHLHLLVGEAVSQTESFFFLE